MGSNLKLFKNKGNFLPNPTLYQQLVGSLIYLTFTQPDISYVVNIVSHFMTSICHLHLTTVYHIIWYLKGVPECGLFFSHGSSLALIAYANVDWVGCPDTHKSTTG